MKKVTSGTDLFNEYRKKYNAKKKSQLSNLIIFPEKFFYMVNMVDEFIIDDDVQHNSPCWRKRYKIKTNN
jgi:hypothetical protein